jgi:hypothetical protein
MCYLFRLLFEHITRNDEVFIFEKYCDICMTNTTMKMNKNCVNYNSNNRFQEFQCTKCNQYKTSCSIFPDDN